MSLHRAARRLALLGALVAPGVLHAQGFGLNEIGTCALSRGYATTGAPCEDPSLIYWNPGAATTLHGWSAYAGIAAIMFDGRFRSDTTGRVDEGDVPIETPPHLFVNYRSAGRWAAGLGMYVPYGLTSRWKEDFPGRFSALKAAIATIYVQPNVAFEIVPGRLSFGGGPVFGYSSVELQQGLDLSQQFVPSTEVPPGTTFGQFGIPTGTEFGRATLDGDATAFGFNLGVHARLTPTVQIGARYLSKLSFEYEDSEATFRQVPTGLTLAANNPLGLPAGTPVDALVAPQFQPGGALVSQAVRTEIDHPAQFQLGLGWSFLPTTSLSLDYTYIWWDAFDVLPLEFQGPAAPSNRVLIEDYENSWSVRSGIQHRLRNQWALRGGFSFVSTPVPDETVTPMLPDQDRFNFNVGLGIPLSDRYALDLGYLRVETEGRRGRIQERPSRSIPAAQINSGWYELEGNIVSLSLRASF